MLHQEALDEYLKALKLGADSHTAAYLRRIGVML